MHHFYYFIEYSEYKNKVDMYNIALKINVKR